MNKKSQQRKDKCPLIPCLISPVTLICSASHTACPILSALSAVELIGKGVGHRLSDT